MGSAQRFFDIVSICLYCYIHLGDSMAEFNPRRVALDESLAVLNIHESLPSINASKITDKIGKFVASETTELAIKEFYKRTEPEVYVKTSGGELKRREIFEDKLEEIKNPNGKAALLDDILPLRITYGQLWTPEQFEADEELTGKTLKAFVSWPTFIIRKSNVIVTDTLIRTSDFSDV